MRSGKAVESSGRRLALLLPDMGGGGAERVVLRLAEDFVARGHRVDVVLLRARGELLPLLPPEVRVVDLKAQRIRSALRPLMRYLRDEKPFALQALMWPLPVLAVVARTLARSKTRLVLAEHTTLSRHYDHFSRTRRFLQRASIRIFYPRAEARVAVSEGSAADLARLGGLDPATVEVVYNPVRPFAAPDAPAPDRSAEPLILSVGSLKPEKNHALLIEAFARLAARRPARLTIVGAGPLEADLKRLAGEERVGDRVSFPGFTADPGLYYRSADLFVLSSDYEGYPLVLIEALSAGLPVVSTDCESGPSEILDGGRFGRLVPAGDAGALEAAMTAALGERADAKLLRDRAETLSGQQTSDRYLALMLGDDG